MLTSIPFVIDDNSIALQPPGRWEAVWLYIPHGLAIKHIVAGPEDSQPTAAATTCYWGSTPPQANASGPPTASHTPPANHVAHPAAAQCFSTRPAEQPGEASARKIPVTAFNIQEAQVPGATADADHSDTSTARTPTRRRRRGRGRGRTPPGSDSSGPSQEVRDPSTCGHFGGGDGEPGHEGDKQHTKICTASAEHFYIGGNEPEPEVTAVTFDTFDMMQTTTENPDKEKTHEATNVNIITVDQTTLVEEEGSGVQDTTIHTNMKCNDDKCDDNDMKSDVNPDIIEQPSFVEKEASDVQDTISQSNMKCDDDINKDLPARLADAMQENSYLREAWRACLKQKIKQKGRR